MDKNYFYAIYAGNIGKMQNIDIILKAAYRLKDKKDIKFLIIGSGTNLNQIKVLAENLVNVRILPMQPQYLATHIYSAADVNLVPLINGGIKTALPSKTAVILSCGRPAIFIYGKNTKFSKMFNNNYLYRVIDDDVSSLVNSIMYYKMKCSIEIRNDYNLFNDLFSKIKNIKKYMNILNKLDK